MRLLLVFASVLAMTYGMLFATFASHTPPPMSMRPHVISPISNASITYVLPDMHAFCTLVCCDDKNAMHYLLYTTENVLARCIWAQADDNTHTSMHEKALLLMRARKWYEDKANTQLQLQWAPKMTDPEDSTAWLMASLYREQFED